jgi:hypothetical protein
MWEDICDYVRETWYTNNHGEALLLIAGMGILSSYYVVKAIRFFVFGIMD